MSSSRYAVFCFVIAAVCAAAAGPAGCCNQCIAPPLEPASEGLSHTATPCARALLSCARGDARLVPGFGGREARRWRDVEFEIEVYEDGMNRLRGDSGAWRVKRSNRGQRRQDRPLTSEKYFDPSKLPEVPWQLPCQRRRFCRDKGAFKQGPAGPVQGQRRARRSVATSSRSTRRASRGQEPDPARGAPARRVTRRPCGERGCRRALPEECVPMPRGLQSAEGPGGDDGSQRCVTDGAGRSCAAVDPNGRPIYGVVSCGRIWRAACDHVEHALAARRRRRSPTEEPA